jgi:hypothetical protein
MSIDIVVRVSRLVPVTPDLKVKATDYGLVELEEIAGLVCRACEAVTKKSAPAFVRCFDASDILQMIYDNNSLTIDGDKGCGALYEIETILDEIEEWFSDDLNLDNAIEGTSFEALGKNIADEGLSSNQVSWLIHDSIHYIKSNMDYVDQPLVLVDTAV